MENKVSILSENIIGIELIYPEKFDICRSKEFIVRPTKRRLFGYDGELESVTKLYISDKYTDIAISVTEEIFNVRDKKPNRDTRRKYSISKFQEVAHDSIEYLLTRLHKKMEENGFTYVIKEIKKDNYRAYRKVAVRVHLSRSNEITISFNDIKTAEKVYDDLMSQWKSNKIVSYDKNNLSKC